MIKGWMEPAAARRRLLLGAGLAALLAGAAQAQTLYAIEIQAGPLDAALLSLAKQTDQQLFFPREMVAGRRAPGLKGRYTPEAALAQLLGATELEARRAGPQVLVVQRRGAEAAQAAPAEANGRRPFVAGDAEPPVAFGPQDAHGAAATTVDTLEVTGTHIRGGATASPVRRVDAAELARSGHATVVDALRALPEVYGGGAAEGTVNNGGERPPRNPGFATALNLRGLGANATLVLVNGRRVAPSGTFGDFVDVSTIPSVAVDRVDVLLDGASALYGSDAVGGVVNLVLKRRMDGAETRLMAGVGARGEPAQFQLSHILGRTWSGGGLVAAYEGQRRDWLPGDTRDFTASADLRPFGGPDLRDTFAFPGNILGADPVTGAQVPLYGVPPGQMGVGLRPSDFVAGRINRGEGREGMDVLPRQTLHAVYLAAEQDLGGGLEVEGDVRFSSRRYKSHQGPAFGSFTVRSNNPYFVSPTGASSHAFAYLFSGDLPNPLAYGAAESLNASVAARYRLPRDWQAEAYVSVGQALEETRNGGLINTLLLNEALGAIADRPDTAFNVARDGYFNPFTGVRGANSPAVLAAIGSGFTNSRSRTRMGVVSLQADGTVIDLPAGPLKLAVGVQGRREGLRRRGVNYLATAAPTPTAGTDLERDVWAGFAELQAPLVSPEMAVPGVARLELSLAGRLEHYEGTGRAANPKVGVLWAPNEDLQLRATYGRSFRAPALRETGDPERYNPQLLNLGAGRLLTLTLTGGNPDLEPERAESWTAGLDWRPVALPGLTLSVTGFDIDFQDRIDQPVSRNLANALQDPTLAAFITRISPATNAADRALIQGYLDSPFLNTLSGVFRAEDYGAIAENRFVNTAKLRVRGFDVGAGYVTDLGADRLALRANASYLADFIQQITPDSPRLDQANVANFPPRLRARATADWTRGPLTLGLAFNWVNAYRDSLGVRIEDQPTFDLQARWTGPEEGRLKGVRALLTVRNVLDRDPPFYANPLGLGYDAASGDPIGRFVSLQLTRAW
ncbi:TonB-dependent receptor [Phenylobacterium sp. VNQ135]|uniref:TonB-dependent receptor n=1 Tax=Phenylobacterium sp. VNQ135 TaxID=3400922 RepID=UPI003BFCF032